MLLSELVIANPRASLIMKTPNLQRGNNSLYQDEGDHVDYDFRSLGREGPANPRSTLALRRLSSTHTIQLPPNPGLIQAPKP